MVRLFTDDSSKNVSVNRCFTEYSKIRMAVKKKFGRKIFNRAISKEQSCALMTHDLVQLSRGCNESQCDIMT